jgi:hypothetical protein
VDILIVGAIATACSGWRALSHRHQRLARLAQTVGGLSANAARFTSLFFFVQLDVSRCIASEYITKSYFYIYLYARRRRIDLGFIAA